MKISAISNLSNKNIQDSTRLINNEMPKFVKYLSKFRNRMGERQDIFINAVGTGIVAPVFIKFNPLSKEDKNTKTYSAFRQTAMTLAGIIIQTGITIPLINKYLDKQIKNGNFGEKFDADKERIKKALRTENLTNTEFEAKTEKIIAERLANIRGFKRIANLLAVFAVIPLTCTVMNKTFPVFMEKVFPKIANNKAESRNEVQNV